MKPPLPSRIKRRHFRIVSSALLSLALLGAPSVSRTQSLEVTGRIQLTGTASSRTVDPSEAVVWLARLGDSTETHTSRSPLRLQLVQKNKSFSPHVLVVSVGAPVEFPNQDPFFHNVFSLFEGRRFDLGLYEAGTSRSVVFNRTGVSYIFCNIHPEMSAVVVTLKTPYYAISEPDGLITITNVPAGMYDMEVWHERVLPESLDNLKRRIAVSAASNSFGILHLTEQRKFSQLHKNKYGQDYDTTIPNAPG